MKTQSEQESVSNEKSQCIAKQQRGAERQGGPEQANGALKSQSLEDSWHGSKSILSMRGGDFIQNLFDNLRRSPPVVET